MKRGVGSSSLWPGVDRTSEVTREDSLLDTAKNDTRLASTTSVFPSEVECLPSFLLIF